MSGADRVTTIALLAVIVGTVGACNGNTGPGSSPAASISSPASTAVASPTPSATSGASAPPAPSAAELVTPEPTEFPLPSPACPSPPEAAAVPNVIVSVGGFAITATNGSSILLTCSTSAVSDAVPADPTVGLAAHPGDHLTLSLPAGWRFLRWAGYDRPAEGEGANVWPAVDTPERPVRIDVPVAVRAGDSIAGYTLWLERADHRVVGQLDILVRESIR
jgi:hypothetical protein